MLGARGHQGNANEHHEIACPLAEWLKLERLTVLCVGEKEAQLELTFLVRVKHGTATS